VSAQRTRLRWSQIGGLGSLSSLLDVELDGLAFLQGLQPASLHRAEVDEDILALLGSDEAVAPVGSNHLTVPLAMIGCLLRGAKRSRWYAAAAARPCRRVTLRAVLYLAIAAFDVLHRGSERR
jgi:hypothetical protein